MSIEWTDATWNPVTGCEAVSPGCANCYAARLAATRLNRNPRYEGLAVLNDSGRGVWSGQVRLHPDRLRDGLALRGRGRRMRREHGRAMRVFVCDMSDVFHPDVPYEFLDRVFAVMALMHHIDFQLLTKRPERAHEYLTAPDRQDCISGAIHAIDDDAPEQILSTLPLRNVWLGTSVEDDARAVERIPHLIKTPTAVRFLSCEPLLGSIDLRVWLEWGSNGPPWLARDCDQGFEPWIIVGGESGPNARPCNINHVRHIVRVARDLRVPVFVKQLGSRVLVENDRIDQFPRDGDGVIYDPEQLGFDHQGELVEVRLNHPRGGDPAEWPEDLRVREMPAPSRTEPITCATSAAPPRRDASPPARAERRP